MANFTGLAGDGQRRSLLPFSGLIADGRRSIISWDINGTGPDGGGAGGVADGSGYGGGSSPEPRAISRVGTTTVRAGDRSPSNPREQHRGREVPDLAGILSHDGDAGLSYALA